MALAARVEAHVDGVEPFVAGLAAARGVGDLNAYFRPRLAGMLPGPEGLRDLPEAVAALCDAVESGTRVALIGDYDVDGATSTALVLRLLQGLGHDAVDWRIPGRLVDGYGPNERLVRELCGEGGARLLIVLDSGTSSPAPLALARELGARVAVIDHHEPGAEVPDCLLVNPKRRDEDGSLSHLCTVGLAFLFAVCCVAKLRERGHFARVGRSEPDLRPLLGLAALGTVADVVPLTGLNRSYVALGMRRIPENLGLQALMDATAERVPTVAACGFVLGPCLNAAGRISDMADSVELLVTADSARAEALASRLADLNRERRGNPEAGHGRGRRAGGGVGSAARPRPPRPARRVVASGRRRPRRLQAPRDLRPARGGHRRPGQGLRALGRGVRLRSGGHRPPPRPASWRRAAGTRWPPGSPAPPARHRPSSGTSTPAMEGFVPQPVPVDLSAEPGEAAPEHVAALRAMEPFGMGNQRPRVVIAGGMVKRVQVIKDAHVKAWVSGPDGVTTAMAFNAVGTPLGDALQASEGRRADLLGTLDVNEYRGDVSAYLKVEDVMVAGEAAGLAGPGRRLTVPGVSRPRRSGARGRARVLGGGGPRGAAVSGPTT